MPAYRQRLKERFSIGPIVSKEVDVWVHAVSLGEVVAAIPLIDALLKQELRVLITTMTPTGSQHVQTRFRDRVAHQYLPYDYPCALRRFFKAINARLGIIMETELWPNLIRYARKASMPVLIANARISDGAYKQYRLARFVFKPVLQELTWVLAQSQLDADRFIALGARASQVQMLGNMKFDLQLTVLSQEIHQQLQALWGQDRPVFIAASTHEGEESAILNECRRLKAAVPNIIVLIAPRHPERFNAVHLLCQSTGLSIGLRSEPSSVNTKNDVVVLDSLGELLGFYKLSDYAFVGGSLVPIGGHNVLEPIAVQVPTLCGPYMNNSKAICSELSAAQALQQLDTAQQIIDAVIQLHCNPEEREKQINRASAVLEANRGTVARHMEVINALLTKEA